MDRVAFQRDAAEDSTPNETSEDTMKFAVAGDYDSVMERLFTICHAGIVTIGTAKSCGRPVPSLACLDEWTLFSDYIMEGICDVSAARLETSVECYS